MSEISIDQLTQLITKAVKENLVSEVAEIVKTATKTANEYVKDVRKDRMTFGGGKDLYTIESSSDGLQFNKNGKDTSLVVGKNGQLATGTKSPRTTGKGSAHFKMGNSEAVIPTNGNYSTRGVLVESDGDDDKTYSFRAVSRMNRQGFNVFGDGSVSLGSMERLDGATLGVYNKESESSSITLTAPSKDFGSAQLTMKAGATPSLRWNAITAYADFGEDTAEQEIFRVAGTGDVYSNGAFMSNSTGFAEMFEWADCNSKDENRYGYTVALDETGKLRIAVEGDQVIGVVVSNSAVIGNVSWNNWHNKFLTDANGLPDRKQCNIVEWLEMETTQVKSYYTDNLPENYALPENATEIQTDADGNDLFVNTTDTEYDINKQYVGRQIRTEWATVCLLGTVPIYKGQTINKNWIKVKDLTDEMELVIVK